MRTLVVVAQDAASAKQWRRRWRIPARRTRLAVGPEDVTGMQASNPLVVQLPGGRDDVVAAARDRWPHTATVGAENRSTLHVFAAGTLLERLAVRLGWS